MKKTKKHRSKTFPSMGRVSRRSMTNIRIPKEVQRKIVIMNRNWLYISFHGGINDYLYSRKLGNAIIFLHNVILLNIKQVNNSKFVLTWDSIDSPQWPQYTNGSDGT